MLLNLARSASQLSREVRRGKGDESNSHPHACITGSKFNPQNPKIINGIHSFGGFLAYVTGRFFKMKQIATPIAVAGSKISVETALRIADISNRGRSVGVGRTVWDMAETFKVPITSVTWRMLDRAEHKPIVIVRAYRSLENTT